MNILKKMAASIFSKSVKKKGDKPKKKGGNKKGSLADQINFGGKSK